MRVLTGSLDAHLCQHMPFYFAELKVLQHEREKDNVQYTKASFAKSLLLTFFFCLCSHLSLFCNDCRELIQVCWLEREGAVSFSSRKSLTAWAACRRAWQGGLHQLQMVGFTYNHSDFPHMPSWFSGLVQVDGEKGIRHHRSFVDCFSTKFEMWTSLF